MLAASAVALALAAHAPVVVHDSRERHRLASVADAPVQVPGVSADRRPALYGRAVSGSRGSTWLQYWLFYAGQDQDRGILRTGRHAGDWELVQYRLDSRTRPVEAVYSQHSGAERCGWRTVRLQDGHPLVFAARGSHASYLRPGTRDRMWPDPNDEADGRGVRVRPRLVRIGERRPGWMRWTGRWGGARARWWVPPEQPSPRGPAFQEDRWRPESWAAQARGCQAGCDAHGECDLPEDLLAGGALAALAGAIGLGAVRRRRRR